MHTLCIQLFALSFILFGIVAKDNGFKTQLRYKPRTAHQLREFSKNGPKLYGQKKYYMPNYAGDSLEFAMEVGTPSIFFLCLTNAFFFRSYLLA
jgi:hypothetical protein